MPTIEIEAGQWGSGERDTVNIVGEKCALMEEWVLENCMTEPQT